MSFDELNPVKIRAVSRVTRFLRRPTRRVLVARLPRLAFLAAIGPGLVSGFADNDAGGITTYSVVGAQFGYELMWVLLASMVALGITQEVGARLGLATGKGLGDLIREQFGIRWATLGITTLLLANLGDTVAEFAGIGAALAIFGVPVPLSAAIAAGLAVYLLARGSFRRIQYLFLAMGIGVSIAYAVSASLARPDWARAATSLAAPHVNLTAAYLLAVLGREVSMATGISPSYQGSAGTNVGDLYLSDGEAARHCPDHTPAAAAP